MLSLANLVLALVMFLVPAAVVLAALFVVVRAAVEQGIRRALPDAALRPDVRAVLREREGGRYRPEPRSGPPPT